jgi:hypothetical protein
LALTQLVLAKCGNAPYRKITLVISAAVLAAALLGEIVWFTLGLGASLTRIASRETWLLPDV